MLQCSHFTPYAVNHQAYLPEDDLNISTVTEQRILKRIFHLMLSRTST